MLCKIYFITYFPNCHNLIFVLPDSTFVGKLFRFCDIKSKIVDGVGDEFCYIFKMRALDAGHRFSYVDRTFDFMCLSKSVVGRSCQNISNYETET